MKKKDILTLIKDWQNRIHCAKKTVIRYKDDVEKANEARGKIRVYTKCIDDLKALL